MFTYTNYSVSFYRPNCYTLFCINFGLKFLYKDRIVYFIWNNQFTFQFNHFKIQFKRQHKYYTDIEQKRDAEPNTGVLVGSGYRCPGWIRILVSWLYPDSGALVKYGYGCPGWIRIQVSWLEPDAGVLVGTGYGCPGWIRIRVSWLDPDMGVLVGSGYTCAG